MFKKQIDNFIYHLFFIFIYLYLTALYLVKFLILNTFTLISLCPKSLLMRHGCIRFLQIHCGKLKTEIWVDNQLVVQSDDATGKVALDETFGA